MLEWFPQSLIRYASQGPLKDRQEEQSEPREWGRRERENGGMSVRVKRKRMGWGGQEEGREDSKCAGVGGIVLLHEPDTPNSKAGPAHMYHAWLQPKELRN